jgi:hypothetical protein
VRSIAWLTFLAACAPVDLTDPVETGAGSTAEAVDCGDGVCVVPADPSMRLDYHRVAVDEDGAAWLMWIEVVDSQLTTVWLARSPSPAAQLDLPVAVPIAEPPIVSSSEKPDLAIGAGRVALSYGGRGSLRHADAHATYVQTGELLEGGGATFAAPVLVEETIGSQWVLEQAHVAIVGAETWNLYKRQVYGITDDPSLAREDEGYDAVSVSPELSTRHECSPPDLIAAAALAPATMTDAPPVAFAAIRSNLEGELHTMVLAADESGFGSPVQVSTGRWEFSDLVCPNDGPVLAQQPDGTLISYWVEPNEEFRYAALISTSSDGGQTWTAPTTDHSPEGNDESNPTVSALEDGQVLTTVQVSGQTRAYLRSSRTAAPVASTLTTPLGDALLDVEVAAGAGRTVGAGVDVEGRLWLVELPAE